MQEETAGNEPVRSRLGRRKDFADAALVFRRRVPHHRPEQRAERPETFVADRETNLGDRKLVQCEHPLGVVDAHSRQEFVGCFSERSGKKPMVVERRQARFARGVGETKRLIDPGRQIIARPAQTAKELIVDQRSEPVGSRVDQRVLHD